MVALLWTPLAAAQSGATEDPPVLGLWENPLPPPLDSVFGTFLLHVLAWLALASLVHYVAVPVLKALARSTKTTVDDRVIDILGKPLFVWLFLLGVYSSLGVLDLSPVVHRVLGVVGSLVIVVLASYVLYRTWNELALVYFKRLAVHHNRAPDGRLLTVLEKFGGIVILLLAALASLETLGVSLGWLVAGGAFASLVIGLAAQDTLSNFFSGIHLLLDQPFREGDDIELETGEVCTVRKVGLRSTRLYYRLRHEVISVPNNLLATSKVTNLVRPDRRHRLQIEVQALYSTDVDQLRNVLTATALAHPLVLRGKDNDPVVQISSLKEWGLGVSMFVWVESYLQRLSVASDLRAAIPRRFAEAGIAIPAPQWVQPVAPPEVPSQPVEPQIGASETGHAKP